MMESSSDCQSCESQPSRDTVRQLVPPDPQIDKAFKAIKALTENRSKRGSFDVNGEHVANKLGTYNTIIRANVGHKIKSLLHEAYINMIYQSQGQFNQ